MRTDFYNDFMRPFDLHSVLRMGLTAQGESAAFLMVTRPRQRERFQDAEVSLIQHLHPHLIRAFELGQKIDATRPRRGGADTVFATSPHALFILDTAAKVLHANPTAEALMAAQGGLSVIAGRLSARATDVTSRLHALVARAGAADVTERRGGSMALPSPARRSPLSVTVAPIRAEAPIALREEPSVLVCVSDLDVRGRIADESLRELFDLSRAEAKVAAALFEGATPKEAGEQLGISFYTVRGHLVRIFEKTGTSRQAELVRLLAAAAVPWIG
jgi:DNA-binding CsgD family transcriptional regulator